MEKIVKFVAIDGKEFDDEDTCDAYEKRIAAPRGIRFFDYDQGELTGNLETIADEAIYLREEWSKIREELTAILSFWNNIIGV